MTAAYRPSTDLPHTTDPDALRRERDAWCETAAEFSRDVDYYRGLVVEIGRGLGHDAYVSDDGSVQQDVLCAKVPELVAARLAERQAGDALLWQFAGYLFGRETLPPTRGSAYDWHDLVREFLGARATQHAAGRPELGDETGG